MIGAVHMMADPYAVRPWVICSSRVLTGTLRWILCRPSCVSLGDLWKT